MNVSSSHSTQSLLGFSMLLYVDVLHLVSLLHCVPWYEYTKVAYSLVQLVMGSGMVFSLWLFRIRLNVLEHVTWCTRVGASFGQMFKSIKPRSGSGESQSACSFFRACVCVVINETYLLINF